MFIAQGNERDLRPQHELVEMLQIGRMRVPSRLCEQAPDLTNVLLADSFYLQAASKSRSVCYFNHRKPSIRTLGKSYQLGSRK